MIFRITRFGGSGRHPKGDVFQPEFQDKSSPALAVLGRNPVNPENHVNPV